MWKSREKYLYLEGLTQKKRKHFCAFRISCHDLEIERGRYSTPPKPTEERICKLCQLQPETEKHFMLFCPRYRFLRLELFKSIAMQDRNVCSIPHCDRFVYLMNNDNVEIIKAVVHYFFKCLQE